MASTTAAFVGQLAVLALDQRGRQQERSGHLMRAARNYRRAATIATSAGLPAQVIDSFLERAATTDARRMMRGFSATFR